MVDFISKILKSIPFLITIFRSLHQFIDRTSHNYAVRIYSGKLEVNLIKTLNGKNFILLNLPFYLAGSVFEYFDWLMSNYNSL